MMRMKVWTVVACVLALTAVTCSKAKVVVLEERVRAKYLGYSVGGPPQYPSWTYKWIECCDARVTNEGNRMAFEVRASAQFSSGHLAEGLINKVNLAPGEVDAFGLYGDTLYTYSSGFALDTAGATPSVTASLSVRWK